MRWAIGRPSAAVGRGTATRTLAYGVEDGVGGFASGVTGDVRPFVGGVTGEVGPLAGHAVTGVQGVAESVTPGYLRNAHASSRLPHAQYGQYGTYAL
ncbi:hypothetical protein OG762_17250 [Streptomyces sp. NBC_01136]|uniref:hypothetical protein n=1 Tax=unclassified Streptomyces TaxID=2593676 RepID=UPI0032516581|nr:hypothetical protein OG762_17250 [Streptomyces sp. NBC_01136]